MPVEIKIEGTEYVGYVWGKQVTRGKNLTKVADKVAKYIKGQH